MYNYSFKRTEYYNDRHELYGGRSHKKGYSLRDICIQYKLYIYLNHEYHLYTIEPQKKKFREYYLKKMGLDYDEINLIMKKPYKQWTEGMKNYMQKVKEHLEFYLDQED